MSQSSNKNTTSDNASTLSEQAPAWLQDFTQQGQSDAQTQALFHHLSKLSDDDIQAREAEIKRLLRNSGFIESGEALKWSLDPLPMLIADQEWQTISDGIAQRLRILKYVLDDLNGEQSLLARNIIPVRDLLQHPFYLREQHTIPASEQGLFLTAFDIGRDIHGNWNILQDHCQFPRGLGLMLENRIIARRVMSDEFADLGVQRIAGFFQLIQQAINEQARGIADPRIVILTSGPDDLYYSEQAYLATYLGYTLVRSADLTVRKGKVWLKSLDGLRRVDVILRWIEDRFLDSLEQNEYSEQGIPGLLQAIRDQNVRLLNPFGNGLLQIPAIKNRLADVSRQCLGEEMIFAEPGSQARNDVEEPDWRRYEFRSYHDPSIRLDGVRHADEIRAFLSGTKPKEGSEHSNQSNQNHYYFWPKITLDSAPFWHNNRLIKKPFLLRCYALYQNGRVDVLPGAMCSSLANGDSQAVLSIKDTWVQAQVAAQDNTPPEPLANLPKKARRAIDMALVEGVIPSRTAENLYWLGCGLERSEYTARLIRLMIDQVSDLVMYPDSNARLSVMRLTHGIQQQTLVYPFLSGDSASTDTKSVSHKQLVIDLIQSSNIAGSLFKSIEMVRYCAMQVRELLSYDSLRIIEDIETEMYALEALTVATPTHELQSTLDRIIGLVMAFNGSTIDTMSGSNGSFMLQLGIRSERIQQLNAMLEFMLADDLQEAEQQSILEVVLMSQVSSVTHKRRYRMFQGVDTALELLLLDLEYPRSMLFQVEQLIALCTKLPRKHATQMSMAERVLFRLKSDCIIVDREELADVTEGKRQNLLALLAKIGQHSMAFQEVIQTAYFTHTKTPRKLNWSQGQDSTPPRANDTETGES